MNAATQTNRTLPTTVVARPCAKINLSLEVLGRRRDGFHNVRSIAIGVDLRDRICLSRSDRNHVTLKCTVEELAGPENLALKAVSLMAQRFDLGPGLHIDLDKHIPIGSGLGGGSADAAAAIALCNELCDLGLDHPSLQSLGAELGSDVPLFFDLPCATMAGRGEVVDPVGLKWRGWVLLVDTGQHVSTPEVYRGWTPGDAPSLRAADPSQILNSESARDLNQMLANELEPAVSRVAPNVGAFLGSLQNLGHGPFRISGAGSVLFRLFDDKNDALDVAADVAQAHSQLSTMVVAAPVAMTPPRSEGEMNGNN